MADTKTSGLTALTGANSAPLDLLNIVDVSDTSMAASGTNKSITRQEIQTYNAGTLTTDVKVLDLSVTWNAGGVTFTGLKFNATSTASAAASLLMDLQVGGVTKFNVDKTGVATFGIGAGSLTGTLGVNANNYLRSSLVLSGAALESTSDFYLSADAGRFFFGASNDVCIRRDAAGTLAQRNSTNAQEFRVYGTYTDANQHHYCSVKTAKTTLSAVSGATVTATNLIPDGAFLIGVTTRVNTTCTTATGYTVGDGSDADLWGVSAAVSAGTATKSSDFTAAGACGFYIAAQSVVITATGGSFDGTGAIEVVAHYLTTEAT